MAARRTASGYCYFSGAKTTNMAESVAQSQDESPQANPTVEESGTNRLAAAFLHWRGILLRPWALLCRWRYQRFSWRDCLQAYCLSSGEPQRWLIGILLCLAGAYLYAPASVKADADRGKAASDARQLALLCCAKTEPTHAITHVAESGKAASSGGPPPAPAQPKAAPPVPTEPWRMISGGLLLFFGIWLTSWRVLRWPLWSQHYWRGQAESFQTSMTSTPAVSNGVTSLMPSQDRFVSRMVERLGSFDMDQPGPLWAIRGGWGSGKSHVMAALAQKLEEKEGIAAVYVHVWREQTEDDLHLAIVEAILSHPKVLRSCFDAYPNTLVLRRLGYVVSRILRRGVSVGNGGVLNIVVDPARALPLLAQRELERVTACARARGKRIVIILDEVDRATIPVAQAAITLTRRALGLPGIATVLPYVGSQLHDKVFNPLYNFSPDLHQTFLANFNSEYSLASEVLREIDEQLDKAPLLARREGDAGGPSTSKEDEGGNTVSSLIERSTLRRVLYEEALIRRYYELPSNDRQRLVEQSAEKYLSLREHMPPLAFDDVPHILRFASLEPVLPKDLKKCINGDFRQASNFFVDALKSGISGYEEDISSRLPSPVIRHMEGRMSEFLSLRLNGSRKDNYNMLCAVFLTVLAWRNAQRLTESN